MLLFDENLSHKLVENLSDDYPGCIHVRDAGLRGTEDFQIWNYCKEQGLMIVSKDTDFRERSFLEGPPPFVFSGGHDAAEEGTLPRQLYVSNKLLIYCLSG